MTTLQGMTGLYPADPQDTTDYMDEGVLESKAFGLDKDHSQYGSQSLGFSGIDPTASPFSGMGVYDGGDSEEFTVPGYPDTRAPGDQTPDVHSAPYPRGILQFANDTPEGLATAGAQMEQLHSQEFGGTNRMVLSSPAGHEEETDYTTDRYDAPNETYQATVTQGQLKVSGNSAGNGHNGGNADPVQGYGVLNPTPEFQMGHSIRRVQHDRMPWDFTNIHEDTVNLFPGRHPVGQMPLDGPDSPYYSQGDISGANIPWEGRIGYPTPYEQPAEPIIIAEPSGDSNDVYAWGGGF